MHISRLTQLLLFTMALATLLMVSTACGSIAPGGRGQTDLSNAKPGDRITLNETLQLDIIPNAVIPYGAEPALGFSDLKLAPNGDLIDGQVSFSRKGQDDFVLVVILSTEEEMLIAYFDPETNLHLHLPSGMVLFGARGGDISGRAQGTIKFSLTGRAFNGYSMFGESGTAYVFAVPGKVNPRSTLPGNQTDPETFLSNSNVLETQFSIE